ncbi:hypothetical protein PoMZ_12025 [Pyricularia oryzae]|uniref:Uncharacterized protein n=1 Tax=Pyricularia oryzae TaxID=318829 RepID=A0A4P7NM33_PYROR|nr:hypothetical protein PoMZ_12025 [Pyricularia oryzae]
MPGSDAGLDSARPSAFSRPIELWVQGLDDALEDILCHIVSARAISIMCAQCDVPLASGIRWKSESLEPSRTPERSAPLGFEMVFWGQRSVKVGACPRASRTNSLSTLEIEVRTAGQARTA